MGIIYGLKVNLSVALVGMLNHTALHELSKSNNHQNTTIVVDENNCQVQNSTGTVEVFRKFLILNILKVYICIPFKLYKI